MQAQGNFFYDFDFFVDLIASIATGGEKSFCQNCNLLLDCLNDYKKSNKKLAFAKYLEKNIKYEKLNNIDDCKEFIDALKKIPLTYIGWSDRERNMLDLIAIPKQSTKPPPNQHRSNSLSNKPNFNNKQKKSYDSNDISPARRPYLVTKPVTFSNMPNIQNKNKKSYDSNDISPVRRPHLVEMPRGLPNIGLSCYMNSALQSLYHDTKFRTAVLKCSPTGPDKNKQHAVKRIFEHLDGKVNIPLDEFRDLYKTLGYRASQEDSLDFKGYIEELFDREKITDNLYKCNSVLMPWAIPNKLNEEIVVNNRAGNLENDNPLLVYKSIIDINIYRTVSEKNGGSVNKKQMEVPISLTFGDYTYSLVAINVHRGDSSQYGHYISYIKKGSVWTKIDNNHVTTCTWEEIKDHVGRNCTFLRYEKIK